MFYGNDKDLKSLFDKKRVGDIDARNRLFDLNIPLVRALSRRYTSGRTDFEDIFQEGCIGLIKALDKYDPNQGTRFSTYAVPFILGEIRSYLRNNGQMVKVSRSYQEYKNRLFKEREKLEQKFKRHPTLDELAQCLGLASEEIALLINATDEKTFPIDEDKIDEKTSNNLITDDLFFSIRFMEVMNKLMLREKQVVVLRYLMDKSQKKAAELLGLSQSYVSRLEKKALKKLKDIDW